MRALAEPVKAVYARFFQELWSFVKTFYYPESDDDWDQAIVTANEIAARYKNPMFNKLIVAVLQESERLWKEELKKKEEAKSA